MERLKAQLNSIVIRDWTLLTSLLLLWFLIQIILFIKFGVRTSVDTELYIADAMNLLDGKLPEGRSIWYVSYSSFLALIFFMGGNNTVVILIQIVLSGLATYCLYQLAMEIFNIREVAILTVVFYLLWIKIHEWNTFLYTESLFTSCCIISLTVLLKSKATWQYLFACVLLIFTFFIRPTGFALAIGLMCFGLFSIKGSFSKKALVPFCLVVAVSAIVVLSGMLESYTLIESYAKAEIIYPNITLGVVAPADVYLPNADHSVLVRVLLFAIYNPLYFLELFFLKLILFLGNIKPYFSTFHKVAIAVTLYPLYLFAIRGFFRFPRHRKEKYFIVGFVVAQALTVALTSENWDGRFLVPLLPFLFLLSANGVVSVFNWSIAKS